MSRPRLDLYDVESVVAMSAAIRAVLEIHQERPEEIKGLCYHCLQNWPCPTYCAIATRLEVGP